jgi:dTDP-4-amino-4,6-dideoxygalactose transaminase
MGVHFTSPQTEFQLIREEWLAAVDDLAGKGVFVGGTPVVNFEKAFAAYLGVPHAVGVGNGTEALQLTLMGLGIQPGDEVITAANTFIATVEAIHFAGAKPVLVDCDPDTYLINPAQVRAAINSKTRAVIPVHLYGQMVDMEEIKSIIQGKNLFLVEDCAQAAGARYHEYAPGSSGDAGCFSFYPDKNLGALGDAGAIVTSNQALLQVLQKLRNHGSTIRYAHEIPGFNSRLDPIQAIALELKLKQLDEWTTKRIANAAKYRELLKDTASVILPSSRNDRSHVFHVYSIRVEAGVRDKLKKHLQKAGILTTVHYPEPIHLSKAFAHLGYHAGDFPIAERNSQEMISLPMHIGLTDADIETVAREIKQFLG